MYTDQNINRNIDLIICSFCLRSGDIFQTVFCVFDVTLFAPCCQYFDGKVAHLMIK